MSVEILISLISIIIGGSATALVFVQRQKGDVASPKNRLLFTDINIASGVMRIALGNLKNVHTTDVQDTNSLDPTIDTGNKVIIADPDIPTLTVGDIVVAQNAQLYRMHRIIQVGTDAQGWFSVTKGDRGPWADAMKWREPDIKAVVLGILY